jgi:hypothetical protein
MIGFIGSHISKIEMWVTRHPPNPGGEVETQKGQNQVILAQKVPKNGQ